MKKYTKINSETIDNWVENGWVWGQPAKEYEIENAKNGICNVLLTPTKFVPTKWLGDLKGKKILGLASGGAQQMPIFSILGAKCTVLDISQKQLESELVYSKKYNYDIQIIKADMTEKLPFLDEEFDIIFHPVSNCYIEDVALVWNECYRVLKKGGSLLSGLDNGINFLFNEDELKIENSLPHNPLKNDELYNKSIEENWGIQFSHTVEEQIDYQLKAGFSLKGIYGDTNGSGALHEKNIDTFYATWSIKL